MSPSDKCRAFFNKPDVLMSFSIIRDINKSLFDNFVILVKIIFCIGFQVFYDDDPRMTFFLVVRDYDACRLLVNIEIYQTTFIYLRWNTVFNLTD